jgi:hypothetical protein
LTLKIMYYQIAAGVGDGLEGIFQTEKITDEPGANIFHAVGEIEGLQHVIPTDGVRLDDVFFKIVSADTAGGPDRV